MGTGRGRRQHQRVDQWLLGGDRGQLRHLSVWPHTPGHAATKHGHGDAPPGRDADAGPTWPGHADALQRSKWTSHGQQDS